MTRPDPLAQLTALRDKVERLVEITRRLGDENRSLRASQEQLMSERAALLSKNEQARSRVEAMIQRLKSLEHNA
ncbi:MAG: TIGR02449 family protein [Pseudomarimonas sp.]